MDESFKGRREDQRLLTGRGRYTADVSLPGQVHGAFLRADRAHAEIAGIDAAAALARPGVLAVFTGADTLAAGFRAPQPMVRVAGRNGTVLQTPHRHMLAVGRVRFVGEPIALVVAQSAAAAQDAAEEILVDFRDLPAVVAVEDALQDGAAQLHDDIPGNLALEYEYGDAAKTTAAFARAAQVATVTVTAQRIVGNPMEPKSALVAFDPATGIYDLYLPHQGTGGLRAEIETITGVPQSQLRVHALDVGGAFGVRNEAYPEFMALLLAARRLGRPVKWVGTRSETIVSDHHGRGARLSGALAVDANGSFLGLRIEWLVNAGAYGSNAGPFINTMASPTSMAVNAYRIPAAYGLNRLVFTNTTPTTAYRGAGRPNVSYLIERLVDEAAALTGIDRVELRRRNLIPREAFPYRTPTGSVYDSGDPAGLLEALLEAADWQGFAARRAGSERDGLLRGRGLAVFIEPSGGGGNEQVAIRFDASGKPVLYCMAGPSGQGHETAFAAVVAEVFGIAAAAITVRCSDPDGPALSGLGSFGSRSLISHGSALMLGAREAVAKGQELAATALEVAASDVVFEAGRYRVSGTDLSIGFGELAARLAAPGGHPLDTTFTLAARGAFPSGAHAAEVTVDPETGVVRIARYTAVDDCGRVLSEAMVAGQLHGGLMQGIGQVLGEQCLYDRESGQLLTGSFMDYMMPRADDLPALSLHHRPVPSPTNPLGAKGAGEAGTTGAIPTLASAVLDALKRRGVTQLDLPFTPNRVWAALHAAGR